MRILVCGGRDYQNRNRVFEVLSDLVNMSEDNPLGDHCTIIHGSCPTGADRWADEWAVVHWKSIDEYPADWKRFGHSAGPRRNTQMIDESAPDLVVAFPGRDGTADCVRKAEAAGIEVMKVDW